MNNMKPELSEVASWQTVLTFGKIQTTEVLKEINLIYH